MVTQYTYGGPTILQKPIFVEMILPFLLVFTIAFAMLQKSEVLGKGKKQMDAIVSLVIALMFVSFINAVGIVVQLMPFLGIALVVIVVFMILWGSVWGNHFPDWLKYTIGVVALVATAVAIIYITGAWDYFYESVTSGGGSSILFNVIMVVVVIAAILGVILGGGKGGDKKS
jgi:hypothetical protein